MRIEPIIKLLKISFKKYVKDDPIRLAGTTAFFLVIAIAPITIMITTIAGTMISKSTIQEKVIMEAEDSFGTQGKDFILNVIENAEMYQDQSIFRIIIGLITILILSTTLFSVVQKSINHIWRVRPKPKRKLMKIIIDRGLSFGMILGIGLVIFITLIFDAGLAILNTLISEDFPLVSLWVIRILNVIILFGITTIVFALVYKFLPDAKISWKVTWMGAWITSFLFTIGKYLIGLMLKSSGVGDLYGTASSFIILLLWLFYSSLIFYFGAEITKQYATLYSINIEPKDQAVAFEINETEST
jgi:membrane protein